MHVIFKNELRTCYVAGTSWDMAEENQTDSSSVPEWLPHFWGRHSTPVLQLQGSVRRMRAGGAWDFSMSRMLSSLFYPQRSGGWDQERRPFEPRKAKAQIAFTMASLPVLAPPAHTRSLPLDLLGLCACCFGGRFGSLNRKGGLLGNSAQSPPSPGFQAVFFPQVFTSFREEKN